MADCEKIQAGQAQRKARLLSQSLSGPFCRIPSPSSSKQAIVIHKAAIIFAPFCRRRHHKKRHGYIYMYCVDPWGRENVNILSRTSSGVSLFIDACVAHLFSKTMFLV